MWSGGGGHAYNWYLGGWGEIVGSSSWLLRRGPSHPYDMRGLAYKGGGGGVNAVRWDEEAKWINKIFSISMCAQQLCNVWSEKVVVISMHCAFNFNEGLRVLELPVS